ncbi:unnamed protein product [Moneuplotes crassus]|uniref:Palmitoyltransferase n=1 Tax=Euplotes crassus TaxID=5936 RepID=A0AAD1XMF7_EUPCR|nr:unnamed protein product [Moneuplotes crassus]
MTLSSIYKNLVCFCKPRRCLFRSLRLLNYIGPLLAMAVYILVLFNIFIYIMILLPLMYVYYGSVVCFLITLFGLFLVFNIWFNHSMGMMIRPGCLKDFYIPEESPEEQQRKRLDVQKHKREFDCGKDMKQLLEYSHCGLKSVVKKNGKVCKRCKWYEELDLSSKESNSDEKRPFKPARFHHCSICQDCVVNMDHHCPWLNNCIGLHNNRYFLLFLFYVWISSVYMCIFLYEWSGHPFFYRYGNAASLTLGLNIGLFFGMGYFNIWQWNLTLQGCPQIDSIQAKRSDKTKGNSTVKKPGFKSWRDNLYLNFGTKNLFTQFLPSMRSLPLNGLEFSIPQPPFKSKTKLY